MVKKFKTISKTSKISKMFKMSKKNKIIISIFAFLVFVYLIGVLFLNNSFSSGTKINNISVSGYSSTGALVKIRSSMEYHKMNVHFENKENANVKYDDSTVSYITLGATFNNQKALSQINKIKSINKWFWPITMFNDSKEYTIYPYDFNEDVLKKTVSRLSYFDQQESKEPKNAYISYNDETKRYIIIPEEYGTNIDINTVYEEFKNKYSENQKEWNINESSLYQKPEITSDNENLNKTLRFANAYLNSYITYKYGNFVIATLTPKNMIEWFDNTGKTSVFLKDNDTDEISEEAKSKMNEEIKKFIQNNLVGKCMTEDKSFSYQSKYGVRTIESRKKELTIDIASETNATYNDLIHNLSIEKEPEFNNNIQSNETMKVIFGNYMEIDREKGCINFYQNDELANCIDIDKKKISQLIQNVYFVSDSTVNDICKDGLSNGSFNLDIQSNWKNEIQNFLTDGMAVIVY